MSPEKDRKKTSRDLALKSKVLDACPDYLTDYELIELLLSAVLGEKSAKSTAKKLSEKFDDLNDIINITDNFNVKNKTDEKAYNTLILIRELLKRSLLEKVARKDLLASFDDLVNYLKFSMASLKIEQLRILFLNRRNFLIKDEILSEGTVSELPVFPRKILKRALFHEASSIIIVHNHPGGSSKPSKRDIKLTAKVVNACNSINIRVLDHIIITKGGYFSFKDTAIDLIEAHEEEAKYIDQ